MIFVDTPDCQRLYLAQSRFNAPAIMRYRFRQAAIQAACLATGNGAANCVCTRGDSCQVERAMISGTTRCTFTSSGKEWYAFGMPSIGCTFGGGSGFVNSPICTEYCE